jgi:hypothetical protein
LEENTASIFRVDYSLGPDSRGYVSLKYQKKKKMKEEKRRAGVYMRTENLETHQTLRRHLFAITMHSHTAYIKMYKVESEIRGQ